MAKDNFDYMKVQIQQCVNEIGTSVNKLTLENKLDVAPILMALYAWAKAIERNIRRDAAESNDVKYYSKNVEDYISALRQSAEIISKYIKINNVEEKT